MLQTLDLLLSIREAHPQLVELLLRSVLLNKGGVVVSQNLLVRLLQSIHLIHGFLSLLESLFFRIKLGVKLKDLSLMINNLFLQTVELSAAIDDRSHENGSLQT